MKVSDLKNINFRYLSLSEKLGIREAGRPVPVLNIVQISESDKHKHRRIFDAKIYKKKSWICGCEETNRLFCYVCLLFGVDDASDAWTRVGVCDLKHLQEKIKKHENSMKHKENVVSFQFLGINNVVESLVCAEYVKVHNESVQKNREIISRIIDVLKVGRTCGLGIGLPLHGDVPELFNEGAIIEKLNHHLNTYFENAEVFKVAPKIIQDGLLDSMLHVYKDYILKSIMQSSFLSCIVDDTTDVSNTVQAAIVFRYELNGNMYECFWGFANLESCDDSALSKSFLEHLKPISEHCPEKLISHNLSNDGINIKEVFSNACYINCYTNQFDNFIERVSSHVSGIRVFFCNIKTISQFFLDSPQRRPALEHICQIELPNPSEATWALQSRILQSIYKDREAFVKYFENIVDGKPRKLNVETTCLAAGILKWLYDDTFQYWLDFFNKIMPRIVQLFSELEKIETNVLRLEKEMVNFEKNILSVRNEIPCALTEEPPIKIKREDVFYEDLDKAAWEVCNCILYQIKEQFEFKNHLYGAKLFLLKNYYAYSSISFPSQVIDRFCEGFPIIDKELLKSELHIFYKRPEVCNSDIFGCLKTLKLLISFGLDVTAFKEISKALRILVTLPMKTKETERCFSTLKLIKTFLKHHVGEDRLDAFGMLFIGGKIVSEIPEFNKLVIEEFCSKTSLKEFHYKE